MTFVADQSADLLRETLVSRILGQLLSNMPVLLLLSGGSAAPVGAAVCRDLERELSTTQPSSQGVPECQVSLVDERFGPTGHFDSNWLFLDQVNLPWVRLSPVPVLTGKNVDHQRFQETVRAFDGFLARAVARHHAGRLFIAAVFGIGEDGHTAGILPGSPASHLSTEATLFATGYYHSPHTRITMTPSFFPHIDLAMVWASGPGKIHPLKALVHDNPYSREPAQLLKLPRETIIHTDQEVSAHEET